MAKYPERRCSYSGTKFRPIRSNQRFSSPQNKAAYFRRAQVRGGQVYELLIKWRKSRGSDKSATLSDICAKVDKWISDDKGSSS